jgi:hypothetical protein
MIDASMVGRHPNSARHSGHPRELFDGQWREKDEYVSCHISIHMSFHIIIHA